MASFCHKPYFMTVKMCHIFFLKRYKLLKLENICIFWLFSIFQNCHITVINFSHNAFIETREVEVMVTGILMAAGFCVYIAATWMYGQKEDQA